jgi:hypothetical protein
MYPHRCHGYGRNTGSIKEEVVSGMGLSQYIKPDQIALFNHLCCRTDRIFPHILLWLGNNHPDEHFQVPEFNNYKLGNRPRVDIL